MNKDPVPLNKKEKISGTEYIKQEFIVGHRGNSRIDAYLAHRLSKTSRNKVQQAIKEGRVFLNGKIPKASQKVEYGDIIQYFSPPPLEKYLPADLSIQILYEDKDILAVSKPSGMSMHPGPGHKGDTLADGIVHYLIQKGFPEDVTPGTVHRLDLPTSGIVLAGKHKEAQQFLGLQFEKREVKKEYLALVWKIPKIKKGWIDAPMDKSHLDRFRWKVDPRGKEAFTFYEVLQEYPCFSLVRAVPKTGRTHQIRVHLDYLGHPILGDPLYGKENYHLAHNQIPGLFPNIRLCLHAERLTFRHPVNHRFFTIVASLPEDFRTIINQIQKFSF
ncbi:MAG: RluA family pseudouridine synthase [Planctomycetota bacterium]|nr:MAG: RluA family pseudouridine synthase [Planctomycetota bacterium]